MIVYGISESSGAVIRHRATDRGSLESNHDLAGRSGHRPELLREILLPLPQSAWGLQVASGPQANRSKPREIAEAVARRVAGF